MSKATSLDPRFSSLAVQESRELGLAATKSWKGSLGLRLQSSYLIEKDRVVLCYESK